MIKVVVLDTKAEETNQYQVREIENDLDTYYDIIGCRCIDIPQRKIGNHYYDIIVDDEGLLQSDPIISAVDKTGSPMLVGTLIVCQSNEEGETIGLTDEEIEEVRKNVHKVTNMLTGQVLTVLHVEY